MDCCWRFGDGSWEVIADLLDALVTCIVKTTGGYPALAICCTAVACVSALALRRVVLMFSAPGRFRAGTAAFALRLMLIVSVASAGAFNPVAMRWQEAVQGVDLYDEHGKEHG